MLLLAVYEITPHRLLPIIGVTRACLAYPKPEGTASAGSTRCGASVENVDVDLAGNCIPSVVEMHEDKMAKHLLLINSIAHGLGGSRS
jgi:hypothetical protein